MCPATVRIISGLRSRRKNVKTVKLIFMNMAPVPEFSLFVASAYVRFFWMENELNQVHEIKRIYQTFLSDLIC